MRSESIVSDEETPVDTSPPDGQGTLQPPDPDDGDQAIRGLIGIDSLRHSARLAGLAGGVLLILIAIVAFLGTSATQLDSYWLALAVLPAVVAAFGGPACAKRLLSRQMLANWRLALLGVMSLNSVAWAYAASVAMYARPVSAALFALALVALAASLLPSLSWFAGLVAQLAVVLLVMLFAVPVPGWDPYLAAFGLCLAFGLLALMAAVYSRRVDLIKGDVHFLRYESAELQQGVADIREQLDESDRRGATLESELAEILDLAEDANRAKTEFLATMSHEIRTPLNGILPILEMLRETPLNGEQQKLIRTAQSSSRHLLRIINDILDFAKVESGKLQLEAIEIDVRELVESVTELMGESARNNNLKLSVSVAPNVPHVVRGDPIRLRQVLINLVSNAIKFTEEGGIRVEVSRGQTSQKEVELLFAVADTGVGMTTETADRLFQSFTQADASTTRKHGGTGLGLVICKRLVELMGGKIGVRSAPGQGSTFWFLVPLRKSITEVPSARTNLDGVRVLTLVPDEEIAARVSRNLHSWGVSEEPTAEPGEALSKLRSSAMLGDSWAYELMLIDGTGIESRLPQLLSEIRATESIKRVHIVLSVRSESLAQKLRRDYGVLVLQDTQRPEPLRRMLYRLFDVETRHYGSPDLRVEEIYDDLNVSAEGVALDEVPIGPFGGEFNGRILLVEDNPVNLGVVRKALSRLGLSCETASDGSEALNRFQREPFDIVFMDCQMPVMDGYEATRRIRRFEEQQARTPTPIVAMTANAMAGDRERCIASGMDDYLAKPVGLQQLRDCVSNWMPVDSRLPAQTYEQVPVAEKQAQERREETMPVLDENVLRELKEIMEEDYLRLLDTYLQNAPRLMDEVRAALARRDVEAMVIPVHSLKSSSANVGAMPLSDLAREAEHQARSGNLADAARAFEEVEVAFRIAEAALRQHVDRASAA